MGCEPWLTLRSRLSGPAAMVSSIIVFGGSSRAWAAFGWDGASAARAAARPTRPTPAPRVPALAKKDCFCSSFSFWALSLGSSAVPLDPLLNKPKRPLLRLLVDGAELTVEAVSDRLDPADLMVCSSKSVSLRLRRDDFFPDWLTLLSLSGGMSWSGGMSPSSLRLLRRLFFSFFG